MESFLSAVKGYGSSTDLFASSRTDSNRSVKKVNENRSSSVDAVPTVNREPKNNNNNNNNNIDSNNSNNNNNNNYTSNGNNNNDDYNTSNVTSSPRPQNSYQEEDETSPVFIKYEDTNTRDHTSKFAMLRSQNYHSRVQPKILLLLTKRDTIAFSRRMTTMTKENSGSWMKSLVTRSNSGQHLTGLTDAELSKVTECNRCKAVFGVVYNRRKNFCILCENFYCSNCFTSILDLSEPGEPNPPPNSKETICNTCGELIETGLRIQKFKQSIANKDSNPLNNYYSVVSEIRSILKTLIPKYESSVRSKSATLETLGSLDKLEKNIMTLLGNFNLGIQQIKKIQIDQKENFREFTVINHIKFGLSEYLRSNLTHFKSLQDERAGRIQRIKDHKNFEENKSVKTTAAEVEVGVPVLMSVNPVIVARKGGRIKLSGANFSRNTRVTIGGVECRVRFVDIETLDVVAPEMKDDGHKTIEVVNPGKGSCKLENILIYFDQFTG